MINCNVTHLFLYIYTKKDRIWYNDKKRQGKKDIRGTP